MRTHSLTHIPAAIAMLCVLVIQVGPGAWTASAAGSTADITAAVLANQNVVLSGASVITVPTGSTTYTGVLSGQGILTIAGHGTLIMTKDSDFTLPTADRHQKVTTSGGNWPYPIVTDPDQPAVIVEPGASLQYGDGGSTGIVGDYPYTQIASPTLNQDNIEVDGTLVLDIANREYNLGTISGSGLISQPRSTWGTLDLADDLPFAGTIGNGTGMNFGSAAFRLSLPHAKAVDNDGSAILAARDYTMVLPQNFVEDAYGSDINFHTWQAGLIVMTGVDEYTDPSLETASLAHTVNERGINIEGAHVQWGDGTTSRFFLPATPQNSYINIHKDGTLALDYDGPVTLDTPISGGVYHDSLSTPAEADITISATKGNAVTFATPMNYHGVTTIGRGAQLLLGTGHAGGDSTLLHGESDDQIVDDGTLTVRNASTATTLENVTGSGGLTQDGRATTTLAGTNTYTGPTTVETGRLTVASGSSGLAASSGVALTGPAAILDLAAAGSQTVKQLSGAAGSSVALGTSTLTVKTTGATSFAGSISGTGDGGVTTTGSGTLTLAGSAATPHGAWHLDEGTLVLGGSATLNVGSLYQAPGQTLSLSLPPSAAASGNALIQANGAVELHGALVVSAASAADPPSSITLIHDADGKVSGTFAGLAQGATVSVGGTTYRIDYAADSGHDVVLSATSAAAATNQSHGRSAAEATATSADSRHRISYALIAMIIGVLVVGAVVILLVRKR